MLVPKRINIFFCKKHKRFPAKDFANLKHQNKHLKSQPNSKQNPHEQISQDKVTSDLLQISLYHSASVFETFRASIFIQIIPSKWVADLKCHCRSCQSENVQKSKRRAVNIKKKFKKYLLWVWIKTSKRRSLNIYELLCVLYKPFCSPTTHLKMDTVRSLYKSDFRPFRYVLL